MSHGFTLYNPLYTIMSLVAVLVSFWIYTALRQTLSWQVRAAIICSSVLSLFASLFSSWAVVLTVAFVPSFIYHMLDPLMLAPFVVEVSGFVGGWCALVMLGEFYSLMLVNYRPPQISVTLTAFIIFISMCYALRGGLADYQIIFHAQQISRYAPAGKDVKRLNEIFQEALRSTDSRMFSDVVSLLALNHNSPPLLLKQIYIKTAALQLDPISRGHIYRTLIKNPNTSPELFEKLIFSLSQTQSLAKDSSAITLPQDHQIPQNSLSALTDYPDCEIRRAIISYPNIAPEVLDAMSRNDPDLGIRHEARQRLDFIRGVSHLEKSSKTPSVYRAPALPTTVLTKIAGIESTAELHDIYNQMSDGDDMQEVLESLASNCFISDELARRIFVKADTMKNYSRTAVLKALASNPKTPADILERLSAEKDLAILRELASNPSISSEEIAKLAPYPDCKIRKKIICSPDTPTSLLRQFRRDGDESVALQANQRLAAQNNYLESCTEVKKLNSSCQKYFSKTSPDMRQYPNTSLRAQPFSKLEDATEKM
jgi:hypothetical protein